MLSVTDEKRVAMSESTDPNNAGVRVSTIVENVLAVFYKSLAEKDEFKDIAERLRNEENFSEATIRKALFGETE